MVVTLYLSGGNERLQRFGNCFWRKRAGASLCSRLRDWVS